MLHNAVAFAYWYAHCRSRADKTSCLLALGVFFGLNVGIFAGAFDYFSITSTALPFANLSIDAVGLSILPWSQDPRVWQHAVCAYAFGQAVHYLLWLRIIPDQALYRPVPVSFRRSVTLLIDDFGRRGLLVLTYALIAACSVWVLCHFKEARIIYFCVAALHGYVEIVALLVAGCSKGVSPEALRSRAPSEQSRGSHSAQIASGAAAMSADNLA